MAIVKCSYKVEFVSFEFCRLWVKCNTNKIKLINRCDSLSQNNNLKVKTPRFQKSRISEYKEIPKIPTLNIPEFQKTCIQDHSVESVDSFDKEKI